jgi:hypothetical protein
MTQDMIPITEVPRRLRQIVETAGAAAEVPNYRAIYHMTLDGSLPAERYRGRHYVSAATLADLARKICARGQREAAHV